MDKKIKKEHLYRLLSIIIAVAVWFYVVLTQDPVMSNKLFSLPIKPIQTTAMDRADLEIISLSVDEVDLALRGKRSLVLSKSKYSASLNFAFISAPGNYSLDVDIARPDGVELRSKKPEKVEAYVDKIITVEKPVVVSYKGDAKPGLEITAAATEAYAFISGPSLMVNKAAYLNAVADISDVTSNTVKNVQLIPMDSSGSPIDSGLIKTAEINLSFIVMQTKTVHIRPQFDLADRVESFEVSPNMITVEGHRDTLLDITELLTEQIILDPDAVKTAASYEVKIIFPQGVSANKNSPASVAVKVIYK